ncbi:hypothetical protein PMAYCL1PPCAC_18572 [Pristionchus mayeri]|uniref:Uncharacterized protein n=1 Tax=Pristionchus mayeri TaxID=1317129 RepID=A0AAN5CPV5_9BILA|nr:hypothetical protein PMAYCL1PPCAC_18572 [Pristionchus mayeri]
MSFNPPSRSQPTGALSPRPLSSSQLESDLNTSQEILIAAALAVRHSIKKRSLSVDRRDRSLDRSRPEEPSTSTPIRSRSPLAAGNKDDNRSTSVPPPKKDSIRALFTTSTPKPADQRLDISGDAKPVHNRIFDDEMERSRPTDAEVDAASQIRALSEGPVDTPGNVSMNDSQTGGDRSLNDSHMTWGAESCLSIASIRTARGGRASTGTSAKAAAAARAYWTDLLKCQRDWYIKVTTAPFSSKAASTHVLDAYTELKGSLCSFSPKPDEAVSAMELFAVHNTRIYVFLTERAIPDSATALAEFVHAVLTKYLANPTQMHENNRAWLLAKHIVELVVVIPTSTDILLSIKSTLSQIQTEFIRIWCSSHAERDLRFIAYSIKCLDGLASILSARLNQLVNGIVFGYGEE